MNALKRLLISPILFVIAFALFAAAMAADSANRKPLPIGVNWIVQSNWPDRKPKKLALITERQELQFAPFHRVLFKKPPAATINGIEATLHVELNGVADLLLDYGDHSGYRLRISRVGAVQSGLFRIDHGITTATAPVHLSEAARTQPYLPVRLAYADGWIEATVDGQPVASLRCKTPPTGTAGFYAPLPGPYSFSVQRTALSGQTDDGVPHRFQTDFARPRYPYGPALRRAVQVLAAWLVLTLVGWASLQLPLRALARKMAIGFGPVLLIHLILFSSHPTLARKLSILALAATYLLTLTRNREQIRWTVSPLSGDATGLSLRSIPEAWRRSLTVRIALISAPLLALALPLSLHYKTLLPDAAGPDRPDAIASETTLTPGHSIDLGRRIQDFTFKAEVTLEKNSTLEVPFRIRTKRKVSDWYALRLTTGTEASQGIVLQDKGEAGSGFVNSFGPERDRPFRALLPVGKPVKVKLVVEGNEATFSLDSELQERWPISEIGVGFVGLVQTKGRSRLTGIQYKPSLERPFSGMAIGRGLYLALGLLALPLAIGVAAIILSWLSSIPFVPTLRFQIALAVLFIAAFALVAIGHPKVASEKHWGLFFPLGVATLLWLGMTLLYLIANRDRARLYSPLMLLLLGAMVLAAEGTVRQSPLDYQWNGDWQGGYARDRFLMTPPQLTMLLPSYLQTPPIKPSVDELREKADGVTRILCLGGSTTKGYGSNEDSDAFPRLLEEQLGHAQYEVINAGVNAYASFDLMLYLDRDLGRLDPDLIVLRTGTNDAFEFNSPLPQAELWERMQDGQASSGVIGMVRRTRLLYGLVLWTASLRRDFPEQFARHNWLGPLLLPDPEPKRFRSPRATPKLFHAQLQKLIQYARDRQIPIILVEEPQIKQLVAIKEGGEPEGTMELAEVVAKIKLVPGAIYYAPTSDRLLEHFSDILMIDNVHTTRRGNELIAEAVAKQVIAWEMNRASRDPSGAAP